jgi:hypothetical protein
MAPLDPQYSVNLTPRLDLVLLMRQVGLPFSEIGRRIGTTRSRASRLHAIAVDRGERLYREGASEVLSPELIALFIGGAAEGVRMLREVADANP